jgi:CTP-dependent riboflavin kinase
MIRSFPRLLHIMKITLRGAVYSGFGKGKYSTQLDWVVEQF